MTKDGERARDFLGRGGTDHRGRRLDEILGWPDARLEREHDFIQWLFPMETPSGVNALAAVPTREDFAQLTLDAAVLAGARAALARMLSFYGLSRDASGAVVRAGQGRERCADWATQATHNDLRLTRILRSLGLLGLHDEARALLEALEALLAEYRGAERALPLRFWREAVREF